MRLLLPAPRPADPTRPRPGRVRAVLALAGALVTASATIAGASTATAAPPEGPFVISGHRLQDGLSASVMWMEVGDGVTVDDAGVSIPVRGETIHDGTVDRTPLAGWISFVSGVSGQTLVLDDLWSDVEREGTPSITLTARTQTGERIRVLGTNIHLRPELFALDRFNELLDQTSGGYQVLQPRVGGGLAPVGWLG